MEMTHHGVHVELHIIKYDILLSPGYSWCVSIIHFVLYYYVVDVFVREMFLHTCASVYVFHNIACADAFAYLPQTASWFEQLWSATG